MRFIDFFAGVGGFRRGMELAGHECVGHCEIDKYAEASYRSMHTITEAQRSVLATMPAQQRRNEIMKGEYLNGEWYADDIRSVRHSDPPEAECYCFGFPCQSFSIAGHRRGFEDTRGTLFFEVMRIAKERQPKILFAENVTGLLNHEGGVTFGTIINAMADLGYAVEWQVLNSRYFGVPQNRERVFIIGHLGNGSGRQVFPIATDHPQADELQGQRNSVVAGCLDTRIDGDTRGTYPIIGGGGTESKRLSQEVISVGFAGLDGGYRKYKECAPALQARDYKQPLMVMTYEHKSKECN